MNDQEKPTAGLAQIAGSKLPHPYADFLRHNTGNIRGDALLLYHAAHIPERNATFEVQRYAPGWLAVGDDSGGRLVLIRLDDTDAAPCLIDAGALGSLPPQELATSWQEWSDRGFPLPPD